MPAPYINKEASSRARIAYRNLRKAEDELSEFDFNGPFRTELGYPFYIVNLERECISLLYIKRKGDPIETGQYRVFRGFGFSTSKDEKFHAKNIKRLRTLISNL